MFQTNPSEFEPAAEGTSANREACGNGNRTCLNGKAKQERSKAQPEFATLEAFAYWLDLQLEQLESKHEGFETVSSVRGFFGR